VLFEVGDAVYHNRTMRYGVVKEMKADGKFVLEMLDSDYY